MTQRLAGQRFRQRKLSTKQNLAVLRESDIDQLPDDDAARHIPKIETGVEKGEEIEHHLQAVISATQAGAKNASLYIPTPPVQTSHLNYERLYPKRFQQPATYIRFSSTVEDCTGNPYCMTAEDAAWLKKLNEKRKSSRKSPEQAVEICSEDAFENAMSFFEATAATKQPFAAVDNAPVLPYEEMQAAFDETIEPDARVFAPQIYEYWKTKRMANNNRPLMPSLKFETNLETDDADPYVCFRRREVRQIRKTRGRDAQVSERLKKLRRELEEARRLMQAVKNREHLVRDQLQLDRTIFEQRVALKEVKRNIGLKSSEDDVLLLNQKVNNSSRSLNRASADLAQTEAKPKPKAETAAVQRGIPGMGPKQQLTRPDGRSILESDLELLSEKQAKRDEEIQRFIEENLEKHKAWNRGWQDITWRPITPPLEQQQKSTFRAARAEFLPTPPASEASDNSGQDKDKEKQGAEDAEMDAVAHRTRSRDPAPIVPRVRYASPPPDQRLPKFRRRTARGGRLMIDRKGPLPGGPSFDPMAIDQRVLDRYKFDRDSSDDDELYEVDVYDNLHMKYRILLERSGSQQSQAAAAAAAAQAQGRRAALEAGNGSAGNGQNRTGALGNQLLPPPAVG